MYAIVLYFISHPAISVLTILPFAFSIFFSLYYDKQKVLALDWPKSIPPKWCYPPFWGIMYCVICYSGKLIYDKGGFEDSVLTAVYILQFDLNFMFPMFAFKMMRLDLAFYDLVGLVLVLGVNVWMFWEIDSMAGMLLVPYLLWEIYAVFVAYELWGRNEAVLERGRM